MIKAAYILIAGSTECRSSTVSIPIGEARRIGVYTRTVGASLDGYSLAVCQVTSSGQQIVVDRIGENKREEIYYGPAEIVVSRPELSGDGCGVYVKDADPDEWRIYARPCYSISDL